MRELNTPSGTWRIDDEFLTSRWECIWGRGCLGIDNVADETHLFGCCSLGAEFSDPHDAANVAALAAMLTPDMWEYHHLGTSESIFADNSQQATRVVDGGCIFLNRQGFSGGAGCALHHGADAFDEPLHEWKPNVCWELPIKADVVVEDGVEVCIIRRWERTDFGADGNEFVWFCTEEGHQHANAFSADSPLIDRNYDELCEMLGEADASAIRDALLGRDNSN